jgi:type I restriction enzyme R subunit
VAGQPHRTDAKDRHGGRRLAGPERTRPPGRSRPGHPPAPVPDEHRGPGREVQGRRYDLLERIETLIADYNAGSVNIDEYLRRLIDLSRTLTEEEQRAVREDLTEEELAIFDLLTKPDPVLTPDELQTVKASAKKLLTHLHDKLVLDWRRKADASADVLVTIKRSLDEDLPADPYPPEVFDTKVQAVYDHVLAAYGDDGTSAYDTVATESAPSAAGGQVTAVTDLARVTEDVMARIRSDATFAARIVELLDHGGDDV